MQDTTQLLIFIQGVNSRFHLTEELLSVESLKSTTTGQDLFDAVKNCVVKSGLMWEKMPSVTDGVRI